MNDRPSPLDAALDPFDDRVRADLGGRTIRSGFIQLAGQGAQLVLMLVSSIVLARLLTPPDFGLFAMVVSLTAFVGSFRGFGLPLAAVQAQSLGPEHASALFWVNMKLTALTFLFVVAMAPVLAWFYSEDRLLAITVVMAAGILSLGVIALHEALLVRGMRFGRLVWSELGALLAGFLTAVGAALSGAGPWALVLQVLVYSLAKTLLVWLSCPWLPARGRRPPGLGELFAFGRHYTGYHIVSHAGRNLDRVLVGYFHGAAPLGLYDNAFRWSHYPTQQLFPPLMRVAVAGLSRLQHDDAAYAAAARRALLPLFSVIFPALVFVALEAHVVIPLLLGEQWMDAVPIFRVLCVAALAASLTRATAWLYLSRGETKRQLQWAVVSTPVLWVGTALGVPWGALGVAVGFTVATCVLTYPGLAFCLASSPLGLRAFLSAATRPALATAAAAAALLGSRLAWDSGAPTRAVAFGIAYLGCWRALPGGGRAATELLGLIHRLRRRPYSPVPVAGASLEGETPLPPIG